jgi:hypothetical protein
MSAFSDTNPSGMINMQHWSSGYDDCLTRSRSPVQSWDAVLLASFYFLLYSFFFLLVLTAQINTVLRGLMV